MVATLLANVNTDTFTHFYTQNTFSYNIMPMKKQPIRIGIKKQHRRNNIKYNEQIEQTPMSEFFIQTSAEKTRKNAVGVVAHINCCCSVKKNLEIIRHAIYNKREFYSFFVSLFTIYFSFNCLTLIIIPKLSSALSMYAKMFKTFDSHF